MPYLVSRTNLQLQDQLLDLDELTEDETSIVFDVKSVGWRAYEHNPETLMVITIEASLDQQHIERSYYTLLDVLADVGGLDGTLALFGNIVISVIYGDAVKDYLVDKLYYFKSSPGQMTTQRHG